LQNALTLKPEAAEVHLELAGIFRNAEYFDLAVEHLDKFLEFSETAGPRPRESTDDFKKRIDNFKLMVKDQEDRIGLQRKRNEYELAKRTQTTLARKANLAAQKGLIKEALELLQNEDDPTVLESPDVLRLAMSLLINTGRLREAKELAKELGDPVFNYLIAAGLGDYVQAQENLEKIVDRGQKGDLQQMLSILRDQGFTSRLGTAGAFSAGPESFFFLARGAAQAGNWADFRVCQGVLALEQGDIKSATDYFHKAFKVGETPASQVLVTGTFAPGLALNAVNFLEANFLVPQNPFNFSTQDVAGHYSSLIQLTAQKKK
jgi:tetratricopeptide (TPR) repeat protein